MRKNPSTKVDRKFQKTSQKMRSDRLKKITAIAIRHKHGENTDDLLESAGLEPENIRPDTASNWSQDQDRSEDLINETDPFIQEPAKIPQTPRDNKL